MSVNHVKRIEGVVNDALKSAAMGEAYGYAISPPAVWPQVNEQGQPIGAGPAWFVMVTIRGGLGEPDVGNGFPVHGVLPPDEAFRQVVTGLLDRCRQERDNKQNAGLAEARAAFQQQMEQAKS